MTLVQAGKYLFMEKETLCVSCQLSETESQNDPSQTFSRVISSRVDAPHMVMVDFNSPRSLSI